MTTQTSRAPSAEPRDVRTRRPRCSFSPFLFYFSFSHLALSATLFRVSFQLRDYCCLSFSSRGVWARAFIVALYRLVVFEKGGGVRQLRERNFWISFFYLPRLAGRTERLMGFWNCFLGEGTGKDFTTVAGVEGVEGLGEATQTHKERYRVVLNVRRT